MQRDSLRSWVASSLGLLTARFFIAVFWEGAALVAVFSKHSLYHRLWPLMAGLFALAAFIFCASVMTMGGKYDLTGGGGVS